MFKFDIFSGALDNVSLYNDIIYITLMFQNMSWAKFNCDIEKDIT